MQDFYDHLYFKATYRTPDLHSHFAKHIILADGGELDCNVAGQEFCCKGLMIQSNVPHTVSAKTGSTLVFLIEETCARAKLMDEKYIGSMPFARIDPVLASEISSLSDEEILSALGLEKNSRSIYDERIQLALNTIAGMESLGAGTIDALCKTVFLSEGRLSHLFREQVGISLVGYLLFSKLSKTYAYLLAGESVTAAAIHAGFSSSAHFAAVNKKQFGISVREVGSIAEILAEK